METQAKKVYCFDDFCLDVTDCQLLRRGEVVALPPKVFDTLRVMVENRGRILDKEFLMKTLWPDTYVEDGTIAQYVFLLRKTLNENSTEQRYIETIPRRGYRFIAAVQELNGNASPENNFHSIPYPSNGASTIATRNQTKAEEIKSAALPLNSNPDASHPLKLRQVPNRVWLLGLLIIAAISVGAFFLFQRSRMTSPASQTMQITKLTGNGKAGLPALSPDGKYVAYRIDDAGKQSIWLRQIAAVTGVPILPADEIEIRGLSFSPDGNYLYFTAYQRPPVYGTLYRIPVLGGSAVKILEDVDSAIAFAPDKKRFAFVRLAPLEGESSIYTANVEGGTPQKIATRKLPDYFHFDGGLSWSPKGEMIACPAGSSNANGPFMNLIAVDSTSGQETILTKNEWRRTGQIAWHNDGSGVVAVARKKDSPLASDQIWFFPFPAGEPRKITNDLNAYEGISLSADSHKLVTVQSARVANFWLVPEGDTKRAKPIEGQSIDHHSHRLGLTWSPLGKLIFGSYASGNADLWQMDADGQNKKQITTDAHVELAPAISNDGRLIAFVSDREGGFSLWRMDVEGINLRRLTDGQADHFPSFTPDGKWIFYTASLHEQPTVWKVPTEGGPAVQFTTTSSLSPAVSPDGNHVALFLADQKELLYKLATVPITGGAPNKIFDIVLSDTSVVRWTADSKMITYIDTKQGISNIWGQPIDGGEARPLTDFKSDRIFRFAWSSDGKALACERGFYVNDVVLMSDVFPS